MQNDVAIILSYFSPVGAKLPEQHFATTLEMCVNTGAEVRVAQAYHPDKEPLPTPGAACSLEFETKDDLFFKENLWNLAAQDCSAPKLLFIDTDVFWQEGVDWLGEVSKALDQYDAIQPFDTAHWLNYQGNIDPSLTRTGWFYNVKHQTCPDCRFCHPGFGFGLTSHFFHEIGGFYEKGVLGSGDHLFCAAVTPERDIVRLFQNAREGRQAEMEGRKANVPQYWQTTAKQFLCPSFLDYRIKVQQVLGGEGRIGYSCSPIFHRWHGRISCRNYHTRLNYVDWPDAEPPIRTRNDGLIEWSIEQPKVKQWWLARDDDGKTPAVKPLRFAPE